ncbi:hypothetical protein LPJ64_003884 [Coemansia asiatica]|uniref:Pentatricopeptide repeat-containing protein n=1 Tax=Coemansia asiatica TaxID=1052880 RepID=A0A9W8CJM4_9FUNG|nr:hypothetical protein LPJ64_003884 [Coemansia asiatica]
MRSVVIAACMHNTRRLLTAPAVSMAANSRSCLAAKQKLSRFLCTGSNAVDRTIRQLLTSGDRKQQEMIVQTEDDMTDSNSSDGLRDVGRRRAKHNIGRCSNASGPVQSRLKIRQRFAEKLESEYQDDLKALESASLSALPAAGQVSEQKHFLVRELISLLRRFNSTDIPSTADGCFIDEHGSEKTLLVEAAWQQYCKIKQHPEAAQIILQIPLASLGLLICELNFMSDGDSEYLVRFNRIVGIFRDFSELGHPITTPLLFSIYLRALNKLGNSQKVLQEVAEYRNMILGENKDDVLSASIVRQLIAAYFATRKPGLAMETFELIRKDPRYANIITPHIFATVISGTLRTRYLNSAMLGLITDELLDLLQTPVYHDSARTGILNELLHQANKHGSPADLFAIFERFASRDMPINYTTFGILLHSACGQETDARMLYRVYQLLVSRVSVYEKLSHHVFAVFINCFVRHERLDYAMMAVDGLRGHPTARLMPQHLSHVFAFFATHGMAKRSLDLFRQMVDVDGMQPTWTICVDVAKAIGRSDEISLNNCSSSDDVSNASEDSLLRALIKCGRNGHISQMFDLFDALRRRFPCSIMPFVAVLLQAHEIARRQASDATNFIGSDEFVSWMQQVRDEIVSGLETIRFPRNLYNMAISIFAILRDHDSVQQLYTHMTIAAGMEPNTRTFNVLLQSFARGHDFLTAENILLDIKYNKMHLNSASGLALIYASFAANCPHTAIDVYAYLVGRPLPLTDYVGFKEFVLNRPIDVYTVALVIKGLVQGGLIKEAVVVFDDAFVLLPFVPRQLLETLVSALEENSYFDFAHLCLKRFSKRVEDSQPGAKKESDGQDVCCASLSDTATPEHLPLSYFGYMLDRSEDKFDK